MNMKKFFLPFLIIFLIAASLSGVSAEEDIITNDEENDIDLNNYDIVITENEQIIQSNAQSTYNVNDSYSNAQIQSVITNAIDGDKIVFAPGNYYDISLSVSKSITFIGAGINATHLYANSSASTISMFNVNAGSTGNIDGTSFYDMSFHILNATNDWTGRIIEISGGKNNVIDSCSFENGNAGIRISQNQGNTTISNCYFTGNTNRTTIGTNSESGTKSINIMGGTNIYIINNTFYGPVLDGLSLASNAKNIYAYGNNFTENIYGIFFGGGLSNINLYENYFENCEVYSVGLVKAASDSKISRNKFILLSESTAIYLEQGNTAHGAATNIGEVYIDDNEFIADSGADPFSIYAVYVYSTGGPLKVSGALEVTNSNLTGGIILFTFHDADWDSSNNINITPSIETSEIIGNDQAFFYGSSFTVQLVDTLGTILTNQTITFTIKDSQGNVVDVINGTTDNEGRATIIMNYTKGNYKVAISYAGSDNLINNAYHTGTNNTFNVTVFYKESVISGTDVTIISSIGYRFEVVVKDEDNKIISGENVTFEINGVKYNRTSDDNGVAGLNINLNSGNYTIKANYNGNEYNEPSNESYTITVVPGMTQLIGENIDFTTKGSQYKTKLVDANGNALAGQVVSIIINGLTYFRTTDTDGYVYLNINLDNGIYSVYSNFDGTLQYAATTGGNRITTNW